MLKKLLIAVLCAANAFAFALETSRIRLVHDGKGGVKLENLQPETDWRHASIQWRMTIGPDGAPAVVSMTPESGDAGELRLTGRTGKVLWRITLRPKGTMIEAVSELTNLTGRELWIEPEINATALPAAFGCFWDGFAGLREIKQQSIVRKGIKGEQERHVGASNMPFPVAAAAAAKGGVFLGGVPFDPFSYAAAGYDPKEQKLSYSIRLVAAPGETIGFRMTAGAAITAYGLQENIIQQYYESYPECWEVVQGQDNPYVWGNHAHYLNWWSQPCAERSRRLGITIEWSYCPYKRSGDMLIRDELWDYQQKNPFRDRVIRFGGIQTSFTDSKNNNIDEFRKLRQDRFRELGRKYGWMFYNTTAGTWCEIQLAQEKYPDSITHDKSVMYILNSWSTAHDQEIRVFPMGTSFAKVFEEDMTILAKELDLPGFALDCAYGGAFYRGPAVEKQLPGRAWDEEGKFIDQSVAINHQIDFIRGINQKPDRKLTTFINGYLKGDYVMAEASYLDTGKYNRWMPLLRWYIGPRPGCVHGHGYLFNQVAPDWRNQKPEYFQELMPKLSDYIIFSQLRYGLTTSYLTMYGTPQQVYVIPEILELMRAGWQVEIPMITEPGMRIPFSARYGRGVDSYFFLGNSGNQPVNGMIGFDNTALNEQGWTILFNRKMRDFAQIDNLLESNFTRINTELPSRVPVIYEAAAAIKKPTATLSCRVKTTRTLHSVRHELAWTGNDAFSSPLLLRQLRGFKLREVRVDGKSVAMSGGQTVPVRIADGTRVEIEYASETFHVPAEVITAFPFTDNGGKVSFKVMVPAGAAQEKTLAERFQTYFTFCRDRKIIVADSPEPVIEEVSAFNPAAGTVSLMIGGGTLPGTGNVPDGVSVSTHGGLVVKAATTAEADAMLTALFNVMDQRYEYVFPFSWVMGLHREVLVHFGMFNKAFPYQRYFEAKQ